MAGGAVLSAFYLLTMKAHLGIYWLIQAGAGAFVYFGTLLLLGAFSPGEIKFVKGFMSLTTVREMVASRGGTRR